METPSLMSYLPILVVLPICTNNMQTAFAMKLEDICPYGCQCKGSVIICDRHVPRRLPDYIRSVELIDIDTDAISRGLICNQSWTNIKHLAIKCRKTCRSDSFVLGDNVFHCLDQLETLQLSHNRISSFNRKTFTGLHNVDTLDLTNCRLICSQHLLKAFSDKTILPQLTKLILVKTCVWNTASRGSYLALNQEIIDVLGERRNLTELNLSWTNLRPEAKSGEKVTIGPLCDSGKILNISNAKIDDSYLIDMTKPCASLRVLDLSGINIPKASAIPQYKGVVNLANYVFHLSAENIMPIGMNVSTLYLNGLPPVSGYRISMHNIVINITFPNELKELHLRGYDLLDLDVNIIGTANRLTYMDISNNKIANIGADVFKSANLERINLANNNLSRTDPFDATFSALFSKNTRLWEVTLAGNQLNHVPKDIFHSNSKLRSVYLSENEFSQISFALGHLKHLTLLDMKNNKIRYLDKMSRINIDELHKSQQTQANNSKTNNTLLVDLRGNLFSCDCEALDFLQWFASSPLFTSKIENNVYFCETNGKKISMNEKAVQASMDNCERPSRKRRMILLSSITSSIALVILTICIVLAVKRRKRRLLQRRYNERVRLLQEDETDFRFLVFLSFASEDDTFMEHHVITPLKRYLAAACNTERDLVCIGDRYFIPGQPIFSEMIRCLDDSAVFIAVMSKNYCNSDYCKLEIEQACLQGKPIILIFIEEVEEAGMTLVIREVFRNYTRIKFVRDNGVYTIQPDWQHVCQAIIQLA